MKNRQVKGICEECGKEVMNHAVVPIPETSSCENENV